MGTSGAYGGSPGWNKVRDQTKEWLDSGGGEGQDDGSPPPPVPPPETPEARPDIPRPTITPTLAGLIAGLGGLLAGGAGRGGAGDGGGGGASGGEDRSTGRAARIGGRALGGAYGARTGAAGALGELGLDLGELSGLTKYQQAKRILDVAIGPRGDVLDSELRKTNAEVVLWALNEEVEPTPADMASRWVVEYVWQIWLTESGPILQEHTGPGYDRLRAEQEMRVALEALVSARARALPEDRPLTSADFTGGIEGALASLRRISGSAA